MVLGGGKMRKKTIVKRRCNIYMIFAMISSINIIFVVFFLTICWVPSNPNFDREINIEMKKLVKQVIQVQYKTHNEETLKEIFTKEAQQKIQDSYNWFFKEETLYFVGNNYMSTLRYSEDKKKWGVSVKIREGILDDGHWLVINMIKDEDGKYKVSFVGVDI